ncbi:hypothetical protein [Paracoccus sp. SM22M-07]|uniref:hypothetical protein n=1 Tax=Paracoccus sp. SM22M-07 TaxID=1520813 RepID=UPI001114BEBF|nr:hypothetical protein [Paracoccus sp. SM22M-07]
MSNHIASIRELIALWPTRQELVNDLGKRGFDVTLGRIHKWAQFGSIPAKYHAATTACAQARGFSFTAEDMAWIHHAPDRSTPNQEPSHDNPHANTAPDAA